MLLYKVMKESGLHEDCIEQAQRLFARLYGAEDFASVPVDEKGRIRLDDYEMKPEVQEKVAKLLNEVTSENIDELADRQGYQDAFLQIFGFRIPNVDYEADVDIM